MAQRGKNFQGSELKQLCFSFLAISQDPCVGSGQKKDSFWERVAEHYELHKPKGTEQRSPKSLETKWGEVQHDTSKFIGCYQQIVDLEISGITLEDILLKAHELYKQRHPKQKSFTFVECFEALKDIPRWATPVDAMTKHKQKTKQAPMRRDSFNTSSGEDIENQPPISPNQVVEDSIDQGSEHGGRMGNVGSFDGKRPARSKISKEIVKRAKLHEDLANMSDHAQKVMAETGRARLKLLEKQQVILETQQFMNIFSLPLHNMDSDERDFMRMWKLDEMQKMKERIARQARVVEEETAATSNSQVPTAPVQATAARSNLPILDLPIPDATDDTTIDEEWPIDP